MLFSLSILFLFMKLFRIWNSNQIIATTPIAWSHEPIVPISFASSVRFSADIAIASPVIIIVFSWRGY